MHLLIVEGNSKEIWAKREASGGVPYHKRFLAMLKILQPVADVEVVFPAEDDSSLPSINKLKTFDGILWTGSSLYINDPIPAVTRQLAFAEDVFESGVPIYGSCWGLQIATMVAGGQVSTSPNGRELGVSKPIELTEAGKNHPYFQGRKEKFNALCIHLDEVVQPPKNSIILARNDHSEVQAMTIKYKNSDFFGVQYHPEFQLSDMIFIIQYLCDFLIDEGRFKSVKIASDFISELQDKNKLPKSVTNYLLHIQEVKYWLNTLAIKD
ncbi:MAG: type 1 glutamine amidotransferase [Bacteroidetes bacterium]|nr:type 1 glutamine amidotransferase [Bacteroidota bacterium]